MSSRLISSDHVTVRPCHMERPTALLSMDLETDFGTGRVEALSQLIRFLGLLADLHLPLTAFVEGQLFQRLPELCRVLVDRDVDVQLHVFDHATRGDSPESLRRGVDAYATFMGRLPEGYRAHSYGLTPALFDALVALGFKWDSSVMRAWGLGHNGHRCFRQGDYFVLGDRLVEFPIGVWRGVNLPLNHPYTLLAGSGGSRLLRAMCGPVGHLVAYNVHMTDLVWSTALGQAPYGRLFEWLQRWMWWGHGSDTMASYSRMCDYLRARGFVFMTSAQCHRQITART